MMPLAELFGSEATGEQEGLAGLLPHAASIDLSRIMGSRLLGGLRRILSTVTDAKRTPVAEQHRTRKDCDQLRDCRSRRWLWERQLEIKEELKDDPNGLLHREGIPLTEGGIPRWSRDDHRQRTHWPTASRG